MTTPWRRLAWTLVLVTLGSLGLTGDAAAYWGVTTLDYGGQLTGYARVEQEAWDPDSDWVCTYGDDFPPYGWICLEGVETFYSVGLEHELRTPTGALHASGAGSSPNGWLQLNLPPHTPTVYGTWTHHGWYFTVEDQYLYVFNPNTWSYDVSPLGVFWVEFGGHSPQVNVPEPSPPPLLVHYVHTDALGSVRLMTDADGQPVTECQYLAFGQDWQSTGAIEECRFALMERAPGTASGSWQGLTYAGARHYHPQSGRFTSVDPGHVGMNLYDPQTWNGYAYARNNPLRFVDPTGTEYEVCAFDGGCLRASDSDFAVLEADPLFQFFDDPLPAVGSLRSGWIWVSDGADRELGFFSPAGRYWQLSDDSIIPNDPVDEPGTAAQMVGPVPIAPSYTGNAITKAFWFRALTAHGIGLVIGEWADRQPCGKIKGLLHAGSAALHFAGGVQGAGWTVSSAVATVTVSETVVGAIVGTAITAGAGWLTYQSASGFIREKDNALHSFSGCTQ